MESPLVSVIVPNYNYARYLDARINSILNQTFQDFELILLDDASTDDSVSVLKKYRNHPKVSNIIINDVNTGSPFVQWHRGLEIARGEYIWIAEADDLAETTFLEKSVGLLKTDDSISIVMAMSHLIDGDGRLSSRAPFERFEADGMAEVFSGRRYVSKEMYAKNSCYNASMAVFRKTAWEKIQNRDYIKMRYCGDWLFWIGVMLNGNVGLIKERLNLFRLHGKSVTDDAHSGAKDILEVWAIQLYLFNIPHLVPFDYSFAMRYRIYRDLRDRNTEFARKIVPLLPSCFWDDLKVTKANFWFYWLYKHFFRWIAVFQNNYFNRLKPLRKFKIRNTD